MYSILPAAAPTYTSALRTETILDGDVRVWTLVKYVFKCMFAFWIVNILLTLPLVLLALVIYGALRSAH